MGSVFGKLFQISTWGESHGGGVGVVIDGCPPRLPLTPEDIQKDLDRRKPGQSKIVTPRKEQDLCQILSGLFEGRTLGTPILIWVKNEDARPEAYSEMEKMYRPSHADYTYEAKYGIRNWQGGGRSSARETIGRVAAGAVAKKILKTLLPKFEILCYVKKVREIEATFDPEKLTFEQIEENILRWPEPATVEKVISFIEEIRSQGDSVGGIVECIVRGIPPGLGEPVFDRLEADLAKAMLSLPASRGFEIGSGFASTTLLGSQHNDPFRIVEGQIHTTTNLSGGVQGGISNGEPILFRIPFKPVATIAKPQQTVTKDGENAELKARGRHDPCVLPRAVPMVEAMTTLVLLDHLMRHRAQCSLLPI